MIPKETYARSMDEPGSKLVKGRTDTHGVGQTRHFGNSAY